VLVHSFIVDRFMMLASKIYFTALVAAKLASAHTAAWAIGSKMSCMSFKC
jgi:hypothetical protein